MTVLTAAAILTLASQYSDWDPNVVVWLALDAGTGHGESSGRTDVVSADGKYVGLLQIDWRLHGYTVEELKDPAKNIAAAYKLYQAAGGWSPWPSAVKYPGFTQGRQAAMTDGICPFSRQVAGVTTYQPGPAPGGLPHVGFVDHAAGGFFGTMLRPDFWNGAGTSVHFAISRDGEIAQIVNIFDIAFAQGRLGPTVTWPPYAELQRLTGTGNPNSYGMVSTEHEDWTLVSGKATAVPGSQWTQAEYDADVKLKRWCIDEVKRVTGKDMVRFGLDSLAGHHMFDGVNRAECPGRFWRNEYRSRLFADLNAQEEDDMFTRFNAIAPSLQGKTAPCAVQLSDFNPAPPAGTKRLRIEVYINAQVSGDVQVKDSSGLYAGRVGWDGARYGVVEVDVSGGGFSLDGSGAIAQVGIVAVAVA